MTDEIFIRIGHETLFNFGGNVAARCACLRCIVIPGQNAARIRYPGELTAP